jgi:hypothetical protein
VGIVGGGKPRSLALPRGWGLSNLALHFEGEDLSADPEPFAATMLVHLRTDVRAGTPLESVMTSDLRALEASPGGPKLVKKGEIVLGEKKAFHLEVTIDQPGDGATKKLQQMIIYCSVDGRIYSIIGTHVAGERYDRVRPRFLDFAEELLASLGVGSP